MQFELFKQYIDGMREFHKREQELYKLGIDINELTGVINKTVLPLKSAVFTKSQSEELDWWLFDLPNAIDGEPVTEWSWVEVNGQRIELDTIEKFFAYLFQDGQEEKGDRVNA